MRSCAYAAQTNLGCLGEQKNLQGLVQKMGEWVMETISEMEGQHVTKKIWSANIPPPLLFVDWGGGGEAFRKKKWGLGGGLMWNGYRFQGTQVLGIKCCVSGYLSSLLWNVDIDENVAL